jgi:cation transport regulator ChaC
MLYFAYGSNMDPAGMRERAPGARALGVAHLDGWRLTFTLAAGDGVWHIEPEPEDEAWGVLWDVTDADLAALDDYEGVAQGAYVREIVPVSRDGRTVDALVYLAVPGGDASPTPEDVAPLVRGAEAHGLPAKYVELLRALG